MTLDDFRIDGKVALITGAGRGIGLGIAQSLASAGATVAIQDIEPDVAERAAASINAEGGRAVSLGGDLTKLEHVAEMVGKTVDLAGGLHIVVNNGSIQIPKRFYEQTIEEMRRQLDCNLLAPILLLKDALPHFRDGNYGRVLNIGSIQARRGVKQMPIYSMTKAALKQLTKTMAAELAPEKFTANCISPGWYDTHRTQNEFDSEAHKVEIGKRIPLGRIGQPGDCGGAAVYLCSPAGGYTTAQSFYVDGGMSIQ